MPDLGRGIKAGLAAGIIYMLVLIMFALITTSILLQCPYSLGSPNLLTPHIERMFGVTGFPAVILVTLLGTLTYAIIGVIGGIIFGLVYATVHNILPGSTSVFKGIALSYIFWLIFSVALGFISGVIDMYYFFLNFVVIGFISSIVYGFSLGKFWDKFGRKRPVIK
ncbi:MAG: DUF6789 family protein [Candidatus Heimdallarchaeaceae archaeon]